MKKGYLTQQFATIDLKIIDESRGEYVITPNPTKIVIEPYILSPIGKLFMTKRKKENGKRGI